MLLVALTRSDDHHKTAGETGRTSDIAFIAMAHHRLGHTDEARGELDRLRGVMQRPQVARFEDNAAFLADAEALIAGDQPDPSFEAGD